SFEDTMAGLSELLRDAPVALGPRLSPEEVVDAVSPWDERLLQEYVAGPEPLSRDRLLDAVVQHARLGHVHPVLAGSALHGVGVDEVLAALPVYLPVVEDDHAASQLHPTIFRI